MLCWNRFQKTVLHHIAPCQLQRFGPAVNLGNVHPDDVISLETLRLGLRADTLELFHGD